MYTSFEENYSCFLLLCRTDNIISILRLLQKNAGYATLLLPSRGNRFTQRWVSSVCLLTEPCWSFCVPLHAVEQIFEFKFMTSSASSTSYARVYFCCFLAANCLKKKPRLQYWQIPNCWSSRLRTADGRFRVVWFDSNLDATDKGVGWVTARLLCSGVGANQVKV